MGKPIKDEDIWRKVPEVAKIFSCLDYKPWELDYCYSATPELLGRLNLDNRYKTALASFHRKQAWRQVVLDLVHGNLSGKLLETLPAMCGHVKINAAEKFLYGHSSAVRASEELPVRIRPTLSILIDQAFRQLREFQKRGGQPAAMAQFKKAFVLLKVPSLFDPELAQESHDDLRAEFGHSVKEFPIIRLFLPSVFAWGAEANSISNADREYVGIWPLDPDHPDWAYASAHIAAYYGAERLGPELMELSPVEAQGRISLHKVQLRTSLIVQNHRNCSAPRNSAWTVTSFIKTHVAIPRLGGYEGLTRPLALKVVQIIKSASAAANAADLPERAHLLRVMRGVRAKLQKEHNICDKELRVIPVEPDFRRKTSLGLWRGSSPRLEG